MEKTNCIKCLKSILEITAKKFSGLCVPCHKNKIRIEKFNLLLSTPGCTICDKTYYTSIRLDQNCEAKILAEKYLRFIKEIKPLKFGFWCECIICRSDWWLNEQKEEIYFIDRKRIPLFENWAKGEYKLPNSLIKKALEIKDTPHGYYNSTYKNIFPCSITTKDKIIYHKSLLIICSEPPLFNPVDKVLFSDIIADIEPSPYTLPWKVRNVTANAMEVHMGCAPTAVVSNNGKKFILNGMVYFFESGNLKGEDIDLFSDQKISEDIKWEYYNKEEDDIYYFFVDL